MSDKIIVLTDTNYETTLKEQTLPTLVMYYAEWCPFCQKALPVLDELATELDGKVAVAKLDTKENPETARGVGVQGIPAWRFFKDGKISKWSGYAPKEGMLDRVNKYLDGTVEVGSDDPPEKPQQQFRKDQQPPNQAVNNTIIEDLQNDPNPNNVMNAVVEIQRLRADIVRMRRFAMQILQPPQQQPNPQMPPQAQVNVGAKGAQGTAKAANVEKKTPEPVPTT